MKSETTVATSASLTLAQLKLEFATDEEMIEKLIEQFEFEWRTAKRPLLAEYVFDFKGNGQGTLFKALFEIDLNYRVSKGELPTGAEYRSKFAEHAEFINAELKSRQVETYFLGGKIGEGGMGGVYKAIHIKLRRIVAVKLIKGDHGTERFLGEMNAIGPLNHANIVRAEHAGNSDRGLFLAMELIEGWNLADLIELQGPLPLPQACELVRQIATGLEYVHQHGRVHRDIKPQNVMLDRHGVVKILDLGLAKWRDAGDERRTETGNVFGTIDYMPPEQFVNVKGVDIRGDIYSLGCTFFYLLTGHAPFSTPDYQSAASKMNAHLHCMPPDIIELQPEVPQEIAKVINRALSKTPEERFQTPQEVATAVKGFASLESLQALIQTTIAIPTAAPLASHIKTKSSRGAFSPTDRNTPKPIISTSPARLSRRTWLLAAIATPVLAGGVLSGIYFSLGPDTPELGRSLATMQGPSGQWWFDEIPQLNPVIRRGLLASPATSTSRANTTKWNRRKQSTTDKEVRELVNSDDPQFIADKPLKLYMSRTEQNTHEQSLLSEIEYLGAGNGVADDDRYLENLQLACDKLQAAWPGLSKADSASKVPPEYQHLYAVLLHKVAVLSREQRDKAFDAAMLAYEQASATYDGESEDVEELALLCKADLARLYYDSSAQRSAIPQYRFVETSLAAKSPENAAFEVYVLCSKAESCYLDQNFETASRALADADQLLKAEGADSPLKALACETWAWLHLEQWMKETNPGNRDELLAKARVKFNAAVIIRQKFAHVDASLVKWLHNRHGLALVDQYAQELGASKTAYRSVIEDMTKHANGKKSLRTRAELHRRLLNSRERMAECDLYAKVPDFQGAIDTYKVATSDAHAAGIDKGEGLLAVARVSCKQAIAESLRNQSLRDQGKTVTETSPLAEEPAQKLLHRVQEQVKAMTPDEQKNIKILISVAESLSNLATKEKSAVAEEVRSHVDAYKKADEGKNMPRDNRRVLKMVCEYLAISFDDMD